MCKEGIEWVCCRAVVSVKLHSNASCVFTAKTPRALSAAAAAAALRSFCWKSVRSWLSICSDSSETCKTSPPDFYQKTKKINEKGDVQLWASLPGWTRGTNWKVSVRVKWTNCSTSAVLQKLTAHRFTLCRRIITVFERGESSAAVSW